MAVIGRGHSHSVWVQRQVEEYQLQAVYAALKGTYHKHVTR